MNVKAVTDVQNRTSSIFIKIAYLYLAIPFLIFTFGWFRLPIAIISAGIVITGLYFAFRYAPKTDISQFSKENIPKILMIVIIAFIWVYMSGIGGFAFQNFDHMWRNAILKNLVEYEWPIIINDASPYFSEPVAMIYYFAFWLPAACVGKVMGLQAAHTFLYFWSVLGVLIVFYLISAFHKKISVPVIIAFVFFSGLDIVGSFLYNNHADFTWFSSEHIEHWAYGFQISSLTTQLFWVFNQSVPAWIVTLMLLHSKDAKSLVFIYSFSLLFCTLPAVGMIPIVAYLAISQCIKMYDKSLEAKKNIKIIAHEIFTFQNVVAGGFIGIMSFLFLKNNSSGSGGIQIIDVKNYFMLYLFFCFFEFIVYFVAIYKTQHKNKLFYLSLFSLLIVPFIKVGANIDFVMRASIPALIILFLMIIDTLKIYIANKKYVNAGVLCLLLALGGITAEHEIMRSVITTSKAGQDPSVSIIAEEIDLMENYMRNNFFGECTDTFFFRYIVRQ